MAPWSVLTYTSSLARALVVAVSAACGLFVSAPIRAADKPLPETIKFNRDVRPILSDTCFKCHGFDAKERKADLRLDTREGALAALKGGKTHGIVPGAPDKSEVYRRVVTDDAGDLMPPPKSGKVLSARQKA